jgi:ATP-binding cassette, subfamily B, bacterial HlyB/CyaB
VQGQFVSKAIFPDDQDQYQEYREKAMWEHEGYGRVMEGNDTPQIDTGLACLVMLAKLHEIAADPDQLAHQFKEDGKPFSKADILSASKQLGLHSKAVTASVARLQRTPLPAMAIAKSGGFFLIARVDGDRVLIFDPMAGRAEAIPLIDLEDRWRGELILYTSRASLNGEMSKFDFTWFIPAMMKYRRLLTEVLLVSLVLQIFALVTPLFFQVVMDKVLVHP